MVDVSKHSLLQKVYDLSLKNEQQPASELQTEIAGEFSDLLTELDATLFPQHEPETVDATSDDRVRNNVMRHEYRILSDAEKHQMATVKNAGLSLHGYIGSLGTSRELSLAQTKAEEAVMWAVKHITG